jgi:hypothetical protein
MKNWFFEKRFSLVDVFVMSFVVAVLKTWVF